MIYIVEIPHRLPPTVWTAGDRAEFISKVHQAHDQSRANGTIYDRATVRELLARQDVTPETADPEDHAAEIELGEAHGYDTAVTLADYSRGAPEGVYVPERGLTEHEACCDYLAHDLRAFHYFEDEAEAVIGLQHEVTGPANALLHQQLVRNGVQ